MSKQENLKKSELVFVRYDETYGAEVYTSYGIKDNRQSNEYLRKLGELK